MKFQKRRSVCIDERSSYSRVVALIKPEITVKFEGFKSLVSWDYLVNSSSQGNYDFNTSDMGEGAMYEQKPIWNSGRLGRGRSLT